MSQVHYLAAGMPLTACGISRATGGFMTSSPHRFAVTCAACKLTREFDASRQRIPDVPRHIGGWASPP
jgi:hypothetical protein